MDILQDMGTWIGNNWQVTVLAALYTADKVAKATPTKKDDFVVDCVGSFLKRLMGKE